MHFFPLISKRHLLAVLLVLSAALAAAQDAAITLIPAVVEVGAPELIHIDAPQSAILEGDWLGRSLQFFPARNGRGWFALAGVDVEAPPGPSTLHIRSTAAGIASDFTRTVEIHESHYRTGALSVAPQFVSPDPEALKTIEAEVKLKEQVFAASNSQPLWAGDFRAPVKAPPTDSFGTRRTFNGQLASIHKGMDFRAPTGTPVRAANSGNVVLARKLYYEGNCVIIDHGLGLFTISMHFSRIDVHEGQRVALGQLLGLSGATGRVTGPHLHWAVRWQDASLDPAKLLHLDLNEAR